jgi:hypothetical protein
MTIRSFQGKHVVGFEVLTDKPVHLRVLLPTHGGADVMPPVVCMPGLSFVPVEVDGWAVLSTACHLDIQLRNEGDEPCVAYMNAVWERPPEAKVDHG